MQIPGKNSPNVVIKYRHIIDIKSDGNLEGNITINFRDNL